MQRLLTDILALLSLLALAGAGTHEAIAQGDVRTATEMLAACRAFLEGPKLLERATQELTLRAGFCAGYVSGIMAEETEACVPPVTAREAVRIVVGYLEAHSDELDKPFDDLVERALIAAWPCKP
jgi:Ssp1 endopeptidase immunity protein Rap1a